MIPPRGKGELYDLDLSNSNEVAIKHGLTQASRVHLYDHPVQSHLHSTMIPFCDQEVNLFHRTITHLGR